MIQRKALIKKTSCGHIRKVLTPPPYSNKLFFVDTVKKICVVLILSYVYAFQSIQNGSYITYYFERKNSNNLKSFQIHTYFYFSEHSASSSPLRKKNYFTCRQGVDTPPPFADMSTTNSSFFIDSFPKLEVILFISVTVMKKKFKQFQATKTQQAISIFLTGKQFTCTLYLNVTLAKSSFRDNYIYANLRFNVRLTWCAGNAFPLIWACLTLSSGSQGPANKQTSQLSR